MKSFVSPMNFENFQKKNASVLVNYQLIYCYVLMYTIPKYFSIKEMLFTHLWSTRTCQASTQTISIFRELWRNWTSLSIKILKDFLFRRKIVCSKPTRAFPENDLSQIVIYFCCHSHVILISSSKHRTQTTFSAAPLDVNLSLVSHF